MKITDVITESKKINEAPVGMLKRAGLGIASKLGSTRAAGALDTAEVANNLKKAFSRFLGQTGQKPNSDSIIAFLQRNGLPTDGAEKAIQQAAAGAGIQMGPAKDMSTTLGIGKNAGGPMATPNPKAPAADAGAPSAPPEKGGKPAAAEPAAAGGSTAVDYDTPAYKRKGQPEPEFMTPQQALKARLKAGKGMGKTAGGGFGAAVKAGKAKGLNMSQDSNGNPIMEVDLKGSTVDKIILAAVQDAIKNGMGQQLSAVSSGSGSGAAGAADDGDQEQGFMAGLKRGLGGGAAQGTQTRGTVNFGKLGELLPGVDPAQLRKAVTNSLAGRPLTREQMGVMATAFGEVIKLDPAAKTQVFQLLKAVRAA
jgi:hypothetical protein